MNKPFQICFFEDSIATSITPYQLTRPAYTIPTGALNIIEKTQFIYPNTPITLLANKRYEPFLKQRFPKMPINVLNKSLPTLYINARCFLTKPHLIELTKGINTEKNYLFINLQDVVAIFADTDTNEAVFERLVKLPSSEEIIEDIRSKCIVEDKKFIKIAHHWSDYVDHLQSAITKDFEDFAKKSFIEGDVSSFTILNDDTNMAIDRTAVLKEFTSIDASKGPVQISAHVTIEPFSRIVGPCYIGPYTTIQANTTIKGSYIGSYCKIGGEVSNSIIQHYSNKNHYGFIGDSILGEWVNLGAGTTTSNLKLSYGNISTPTANDSIATNRQFLGSVFGDYVRTGIQSSFDCGSVVSSATSLFGTDTHAKYIPPFTWGKPSQYHHQDIVAFLAATERMMKRRDMQLSEEQKMIFKHLHEATLIPSSAS